VRRAFKRRNYIDFSYGKVQVRKTGILRQALMERVPVFNFSGLPFARFYDIV
jgi:hypothetical protein